MRSRFASAALASLLAACADQGGNPFAAVSQPPSADAVLMFVSSSWSNQLGQPRELLALNADGSRPERLTGCALAEQPCDVLQFAVSPEINRVAVVRSIPGAAPGASALYFVDLGRSVESPLISQRRISQVDWSPNGQRLIYTSPGTSANGVDALYLCQPNGAEDQILTATAGLRERDARFAPSSQSAVFERFDAGGVSRIYIFQSVPVTDLPAACATPAGPALEGTPYVVGADADPVFSPDGSAVAFRRLTALGNGGLGVWDLMVSSLADLGGDADGDGCPDVAPRVLASGTVSRGAPDWGPRGLLLVETDAATGLSQLVSMQPDGSGRTVLRTEPAAFGMAAPRWIPGR